MVTESWFTLAAITTVLSPIAVTKPDWSTVATDESPLLQLTVVPAMTLAFWSRTSAVSYTLVPNAASWAVAGLTVIVVRRAGSGAGGAAGLSPSPHPLTKATAVSAADCRMMVR